MQINIKNLIDDVQCYQTVRELRWPDGVACAACQSQQVIKRGFDDQNWHANAMSATTVTHALMI